MEMQYDILFEIYFPNKNRELVRTPAGRSPDLHVVQRMRNIRFHPRIFSSAVNSGLPSLLRPAPASIGAPVYAAVGAGIKSGRGRRRRADRYEANVSFHRKAGIGRLPSRAPIGALVYASDSGIYCGRCRRVDCQWGRVPVCLRTGCDRKGHTEDVQNQHGK